MADQMIILTRPRYYATASKGCQEVFGEFFEFIPLCHMLPAIADAIAVPSQMPDPGYYHG